MANVYVGFHDQRSCNRILKPPGGGSSNIFGTDRVPTEADVPQIFEKAASVQETLQTETVVTKKSVTDQNGTTLTETSTEFKTEQNGSHTDENGVSQSNGHAEHSVTKDVFVTNGNGVAKEDGSNEVADKVGKISIQDSEQEESKTEVTEAVDSATVQSSTKTVITSSVEVKSTKRSSTNSTMADVLNQDGVAVREVDAPRKEKPKTPNRVPPGGFSSGLW